MRILHVLFKWVTEDPRGAETYAHGLATQQALDHDVAVFHGRFADSDGLRRETAGGLLIFSVGLGEADFQRAASTYRGDRIELAFQDVLAAYRPVVVHFHHLAYLSMALPGIAKSQGASTVFTLHDAWLICPQATLLDPRHQICETINRNRCYSCCLARSGSRVEGLSAKLSKAARFAFRILWDRPRAVRRLAESVDLFVSPSRHLRTRFVQAGFPEGKIAFSPYGLDCRTSMREPRPRDPKRIQFGFLGTIAAYKGIHVLLRAFSRVPEAHLKIFGRAPKDLLEEYGAHPTIRFAGEIPAGSKGWAYRGLDVVVVPSIWVENAPLVILEAFSHGIPVVGSNIGGMAELVTDGVNGLHFRAGDAEDLARKIRFLVERPDEVRRLGGNTPPVRPVRDDAAWALEQYRRLRALTQELAPSR